MKIKNLASLYRELGPRWTFIRLAYAFRLRTGLIRLQMPQYKWTDRPLATWLAKDIPSSLEVYAYWRRQNSPKFLFDLPLATLSESNASLTKAGTHVSWSPQAAITEAEKIMSGEIKYFAHEFQEVGFPPNWHKDPVSGIESYSNKHWSYLSDDGEVDIKFIWEASRFSMVYSLVRAYGSAKDERYAEAFWKLILDWAEHNPPNTGPNWMDGQEIALRLMAWMFGFYAFLNSPSTTPERISQFTVFVASQAERIYKNIGYAISTRSNHTISEAFGLWMVGLLFPELKNAEKYLSLGKQLLEQEATNQIFPDGSYSMYSLNYHRFILHIYLYAIQLGNRNHFPLSTELQRSVSNSISYLSHLINPQTGQMPVYGSNDGALVLPLNNCDFTDYRPLLQLGSFITTGKLLFEPGEWDEDVFWLCGMSSLSNREVEKPSQHRVSFPYGGTYILRNTNSKAIIRCTDFQSRPSHADQLHVDLWIDGHNIACDAGTYLYSGPGVWRNGLAHTSAHNTVSVDQNDQMKMISRFTWTDWSKGIAIQNIENLWRGEHDGYKPVSHKRTVMMLEGDRWLVVDQLNANQAHHYSLHWLLNDSGVQELVSEKGLLLTLPDSKVKMQVGVLDGNSNFSMVRADPNSTRGWRSRYYGHKEPAVSVMLETDQPRACFWTFFGFESDRIEVKDHYLKINSPNMSSSIDLDTLAFPEQIASRDFYNL